MPVFGKCLRSRQKLVTQDQIIDTIWQDVTDNRDGPLSVLCEFPFEGNNA